MAQATSIGDAVPLQELQLTRERYFCGLRLTRLSGNSGSYHGEIAKDQSKYLLCVWDHR